MLRRLSRSLSFRLLAIFLVLALMFVYGTFTALRWVYNSDEIRGLISGHLSLHVHYVKEDIGSPPRIDRAIAITESVPVDIRILGPGIDWASDTNFPELETLNFGPSPKFSDDADAWVDELQGLEFAVESRHRFIKIHQDEYDIVVASPRIADVSTGPDLITIIVSLGLVYLMIGYAAVSWLFKPIRSIRAGAAQIGEGNFDHRIRNIRHDQLGDLASDINRLADDVEDMLDAKRALLLGISHELRTPLSRMRLMLEFIENQADRESLKPEIDEMEKIVVSLLEAERLSTRHVTLNRSGVNISTLISELINNYFSRDRQRVFAHVAANDLVANVDEARISLLLKNLVSNALRYLPEQGGRVDVTAEADGDDLVLRVEDNGPGVSKDQAEHLGEPFYRGDPSRTRDTGGTGLGLYLATLVAAAHGGSLVLTNPDQDGACFESRIPLGLDISP
ncbi:MAG: HAMP domain-containing protein [Gammaproteobacteria bacterium]|nr:HAMP domain-containing protein [Gammaproteobacteria bacterium]MBT8111059.1 HAMP domain-containing protein [Gammaproteobacteria bacterium]NND47976.1 HAMP domain-containing protein [Woeseiaceae bacterium]NNL45757.1 HAMP domain-containing protein [Woeseiaceae bacterium]